MGNRGKLISSAWGVCWCDTDTHTALQVQEMCLTFKQMSVAAVAFILQTLANYICVITCVHAHVHITYVCIITCIEDKSSIVIIM